MSSFHLVAATCAESDVEYVRGTLVEHCDLELVDVAHDGARVLAVFDLGHLDRGEHGAWLERARRWMQAAISRHEVVR